MTVLTGNPAALVHRYHPRGTAATLMEARDPEVVISGPAGTGKSLACLQKMHMVMLLSRGARGLIVRKTLASLGSTALVTWREKVVAEALSARLVKFYGGSREEAAGYRYSNRSNVVIGGLDKSTKIMSSDYDMIYVQEATELVTDDWEALTTRLRHGIVSFQQLLADCNPNAPQHWLNQRALSGRTVMLFSQHRDNPLLYNDDGTQTAIGKDYLAKLEALTGVRRARLYEGKWVAAEGLVFEEYDPAIHLADPIAKLPEGWTLYLAVDFGYRNPFVCQWWAIDTDGRMWLYREIYKTGRLVEDHAKQIKAIMERAGEPMPRAVVCDHDAEDRATLERHLGLSTVAAIKTVSDGVQNVQSRLKVQADGKPRLFLCRDAVVERDTELADSKKPASTVEEIAEYVWDPTQMAGKPVKDTPLKLHDHGMDGMRYAAAQLDLGRTPRMRWLT